MQGQRNRLIPVETTQEPGEASPSAENRVETSATWMLMTALRTLSERALVALAAIEHLIIAGSAFAMWLSVIHQPSELQLVGVGLYALFCLSVIFLRR